MNLSPPIVHDLAAHLQLLQGLSEDPRAPLGRLFERGAPIYAARAPGRLDVMGGIADYSDSRVLQQAAAAGVRRPCSAAPAPTEPSSTSPGVSLLQRCRV